jgi:phosphoglucosamine mutase
MKNLVKILPKEIGNVREVITVDGIGLNLQDGWILVRPSGTEPVIRITCEASSDERVKEILEKSRAIVERVIASEYRSL